MKDLNFNNFILDNDINIPDEISIGVVSVPSGLNFSSQINKVITLYKHANMKITFSNTEPGILVVAKIAGSSSLDRPINLA